MTNELSSNSWEKQINTQDNNMKDSYKRAQQLKEFLKNPVRTEQNEWLWKK